MDVLPDRCRIHSLLEPLLRVMHLFLRRRLRIVFECAEQILFSLRVNRVQ